MTKYKTLDRINIGENAVIIGFDNTQSNILTEHLTTLGFIPGEEVTPVLKSPLGDPVSYLLNKSVHIALRTKDAKSIIVE